MMVKHMVKALAAAGVATLLAGGMTYSTPAYAHYVQAPCDFVTAGGFVFKDNGQRANFGVHGGCKNGEFWGHVNYVDHDGQYHLNSTRITGYLVDPATPNARDICGWGRVNDSDHEVQFRVRVVDNGEPGRNDNFGIIMDRPVRPANQDRFYVLTTRSLAAERNGGGNVQLHKSNPSNTIDPGYFSLQEWQMCGDISNP